METTLYAMVQLSDRIPCVIGKDHKLFTSIEEAKKEYLELSETWYKAAAEEFAKDQKIKNWMKEHPILVQLTPTILSPKTDDHFHQIIQAYANYLDKREEINKDVDTFLKNVDNKYKDTISEILSV